MLTIVERDNAGETASDEVLDLDALQRVKMSRKKIGTEPLRNPSGTYIKSDP